MRYHWLLDVSAGGVALRYSVDGASPTTAAGVALDYAPGLEPLELAQGDPEGADVTLADASVDWPAVGPLLDGAEVVLRRWREGTALEQAETFARGTATDTEWETAADPVAWTVLPVETLPPMPDLAKAVGPITTLVDEGVTEIPPGQTGLLYPVVYGFPGYLVRQYVGPTSGLIASHVPVVPCPMRAKFRAAASAPSSQIVISHDAGACLPATVRIRHGGTGYEADCVVSAVTDELGHRIAVATFADMRLFPLDDDAPEYTAAYGPSHGGLAAPRDAYDVIVDVLERWGGSTVDWSRVPEVADALRGYLVDTWITAPPDGGVWAWLVAALGVGEAGATEPAEGGLPVAIRTSAGGNYLVALRYTTDPARTVRTVRAGEGEASRVGPLRTRGAPVNVVEVQYGYDLSAFAGETVASPAVLAVTSEIGTSSLTAVAPNSLATASQARYGVRAGRVEAPWTWDHGTAIRLAQDLLERVALPPTTAQYRVPEEWGLREGDQVRIVDEDVGLDALAIVEGPPYISADGVTVTLRIPGRA